MSRLSKMALLEVALELGRIDHRLAEIRSTIGLPPNLAEMEEGSSGSWTTEQAQNAYLSGIIVHVRALLEDAIDTLKLASEITDAELRAEHSLQQQGVRPFPAKPSAYAIVFALTGPIIFLTIFSPRS